MKEILIIYITILYQEIAIYMINSLCLSKKEKSYFKREPTTRDNKKGTPQPNL